MLLAICRLLGRGICRRRVGDGPRWPQLAWHGTVCMGRLLLLMLAVEGCHLLLIALRSLMAWVVSGRGMSRMLLLGRSIVGIGEVRSLRMQSPVGGFILGSPHVQVNAWHALPDIAQLVLLEGIMSDEVVAHAALPALGLGMEVKPRVVHRDALVDLLQGEALRRRAQRLVDERTVVLGGLLKLLLGVVFPVQLQGR